MKQTSAFLRATQFFASSASTAARPDAVSGQGIVVNIWFQIDRGETSDEEGIEGSKSASQSHDSLVGPFEKAAKWVAHRSTSIPRHGSLAAYTVYEPVRKFGVVLLGQIFTQIDTTYRLR